MPAESRELGVLRSLLYLVLLLSALGMGQAYGWEGRDDALGASIAYLRSKGDLETARERVEQRERLFTNNSNTVYTSMICFVVSLAGLAASKPGQSG